MPDFLIPVVLLGAAAALLGGVWVAVQGKQRSDTPAGSVRPPPARQTESAREKQLLNMLRGDRAVMERLITGQGRRQGRVSRSELVERVIVELERDRR